MQAAALDTGSALDSFEYLSGLWMKNLFPFCVFGSGHDMSIATTLSGQLEEIA